MALSAKERLSATIAVFRLNVSNTSDTLPLSPMMTLFGSAHNMSAEPSKEVTDGRCKAGNVIGHLEKSSHVPYG